MTTPQDTAASPVGIDVSSTARARTTGWERFTQGLADHTKAAKLAPTRKATTKAGNLVAQLRWRAHGLPQAVAESGVELLHAPAYPPPPLPVPITWSVFDSLVLGLHPEHASKGVKLWAPLGRRAAHRVERIVTYTNAVADEFERFGIPRDRIEVLPPAVTPVAVPSRAPSVTDHKGQSVHMPSEFVLYVGTLTQRKRPDVAAQIAAVAAVPIVFVGRRTGEPVDIAANVPGAFFAGAATDAELAWCYHNAAALISPSEYEGIDLPALEAVSVGTPVLASDIPVHRELATAAFFDHSDIDAAVAALVRIAADPRTPVEVPRWDVCAAAHEDLWKRIAQEAAR